VVSGGASAEGSDDASVEGSFLVKPPQERSSKETVARAGILAARMAGR
jgi:hypothetical protein